MTQTKISGRFVEAFVAVSVNLKVIYVSNEKLLELWDRFSNQNDTDKMVKWLAEELSKDEYTKF